MSLAVIIPAFKSKFLDLTLKSISLQSNKNFTVYIGDDNSPHNLFEIVKKYTDEINIVYTKFEENIGSSNLINQWHRCISLSENEKWIWLFSDDDLMDVDCVESFYNTRVNNPKQYDLYRFDTDMIDANNSILYQNPIFDADTPVYDFVNKKLKGEIRSFVSEYIFSKKVYLEKGGFVEFPLAWASDDATWVKFGYENGIHTIPGAKVSWRLSDVNISNSGNAHGNKKCVALIQYSDWLINFFKGKYDLKESKKNLKNFFLGQFHHYKISLKPKFLFYLYQNLNRTLGISYFEFTIFLIRSKVLNR